MMRYKRIKDGVVTNVWTSGMAGKDYVEPGWGDASSYQIVEEDITAEIAAEQAKVIDRDDATRFLKGLKAADLVDVPSCARAIMKIVKHLRADG